jgi:hypothetical protein
MSFHVPERFRVTRGTFGTTPANGNNGLFLVTLAHKQQVRVIVSDGEGWEHVSISRTERCPTWDEMCQVKALFWDDEDTVMQLHPPRSTWVSNHAFCLHLWRPIGADIPRPPSLMVGIAELGTLK